MPKFGQQEMSNAVNEYDEINGINTNHTPAHLRLRTPQGSSNTVDHTRRDVDMTSFSMAPDIDLYSRVCTMSLGNRFYESDRESMGELVRLIGENTPEFVAKLAVYAREKMYLRQIPLILVVELAKIHRGDDLISRTIQRVVQRADEITELLAYYQVSNSRDGQTKKLNKLSNQIKKGIRKVFESGRFDEYNYSKYNRGSNVRLRDALFLTHPKPQNKEQKSLFDKIASDTLEIPFTWETQLSESGQTGQSKKIVWETLIDSGKMGYMAMLRNIRNFLKEDVSMEHIKKVCSTLSDRDMVLKSKQLPFRYLSAYRVLIGTNYGWGFENQIPDYITNSPYLDMILDTLETAISYSVDNMPDFRDKNVLLSTDVSGSMISPISPKSVVQGFDIGALMCMIADKAFKNSTTSIFGDDMMILESGGDKILNNVQEVYNEEGKVGYSTNGWKVIDYALQSEQSYDNIMIFTDCMLYGRTSGSRYIDNHTVDELWSLYRNRYPQAKLYLFNLSSYGTTPVKMLNNGVFLISGFSDKIFDILHRVENGGTAMGEIMDTPL
ncbi:MAG: TROVE domain-containing protein [Candidatus Peribacteraceae bacterium]|nr:TROVE domain-containing protein [Candidatus Peribacteraceae bacterium]